MMKILEQVKRGKMLYTPRDIQDMKESILALKEAGYGFTITTDSKIAIYHLTSKYRK